MPKCSVCGKVYKTDGKWYKKHVSDCEARHEQKTEQLKDQAETLATLLEKYLPMMQQRARAFEEIMNVFNPDSKEKTNRLLKEFFEDPLHALVDVRVDSEENTNNIRDIKAKFFLHVLLVHIVDDRNYEVITQHPNEAIDDKGNFLIKNAVKMVDNEGIIHFNNEELGSIIYYFKAKDYKLFFAIFLPELYVEKIKTGISEILKRFIDETRGSVWFHKCLKEKDPEKLLDAWIEERYEKIREIIE